MMPKSRFYFQTRTVIWLQSAALLLSSLNGNMSWYRCKRFSAAAGKRQGSNPRRRSYSCWCCSLALPCAGPVFSILPSSQRRLRETQLATNYSADTPPHQYVNMVLVRPLRRRLLRAFELLKWSLSVSHTPQPSARLEAERSRPRPPANHHHPFSTHQTQIK